MEDHAAALQVVGGAEFLNVYSTEQLQAQMMVWLGAFQSVWDLALIVFGLHLCVLGFLVFRSGKTGLKVLGVLVVAAGLGYLIDGCGKVLVPELAGVAVYLLMAVVLLFRPAGLFGRTGA